MPRPGAGGEYADPCVACFVVATLGDMLLDALLRTPAADAVPGPHTASTRTLLGVARAGGVGAVLVLVGPLSLALAVSLRGLSGDALLGGGGLALGGLLGVVAQSHVAHWTTDWRPRTLLAATMAWCAPQLALLSWVGGGIRSRVPAIALGALAWAALIWTASSVEGLGLLIGLLVGAVLLLEVVAGCMVAWRRFG